MTEKTYYCMAQKVEQVFLIYGIGFTEKEARADALFWSDGDESVILDMYPCTEEMYNYVNLVGGGAGKGFRFEVVDGVMSVEPEGTGGRWNKNNLR